jgi:PIN domain nuclease of toxin-antitoxin system
MDISAVNLCEVYYIIMRERSQESAEILATSMQEWGLTIVPADEDIAKRAGQSKARYSLSLADLKILHEIWICRIGMITVSGSDPPPLDATEKIIFLSLT